MSNSLTFEINYNPQFVKTGTVEKYPFYFEFYLDGKVIGRSKKTSSYVLTNGVHTVQCFFCYPKTDNPRTELGVYQFEINNESKVFTLNTYLLNYQHIDFLEGSCEFDFAKIPKGCYIATCVYGSYDCPEVWTLRRYRDETLGSTWYGRLFIRTYYAISPTIVKWFGNTMWFKKIWRGTLNRIVKKLEENGVENTPYEDKRW